MTTATGGEVQPKQRSYFAHNSAHRFILNDGESFIEHKPLDEGLFQSFQDINSKIKLDRTGDTTEVDIKVGAQRQFLLENLVTGWNLVEEDGKPTLFTQAKLKSLPPHIISKLVDDIYDKNEILRPEQADGEAGKGQEKNS